MGESAAGVLTFFGTLITSVITWLGEVVTFVSDQPLILIPMLAFFLIGGTVGILMRLMRG